MLRQVTCQPIRSVHTSRRRRVSPFKEDIANEGGVRGLRRLSDYKPLGIVQKLGKTLGVKDHVDDHWLVSLLALNKVKECITEIAKYLGLPIQIDLSYVPRGYRKVFFVLKDFSEKHRETLAVYYLRTYEHLIPCDVEFWEYDTATKTAERLR